MERRFNKVTERILDQARERDLLPEGEEVLEVARGQTRFSPVLYFVLIGFLLVFLVRERAVVVTSRALYVFNMEDNETREAISLELMAPLDGAQVSASKSTLSIEGTATIYTLRSKEIRHIAELVEQAQDGGLEQAVSS